MTKTDIITLLESEGFCLKLIGKELAISSYPDQLDEKRAGLLSICREDLIRLLQVKESLDRSKPYLSRQSNLLAHETLLVPTDCHPKYRYWLPPMSCFIVTNGDWLTNPIVKEWRPQTIEETLKELNATEGVIADYQGFAVTEDVLEKSIHGKLDEDWYPPEMRRTGKTSLLPRSGNDTATGISQKIGDNCVLETC